MDAVEGASAGPIPSLYLERDGVAETARRLLARAAGGHGGALFLLAEGGLGKTTGLETTRNMVAPGWVVASAKADAMESSLPFGLLRQALRQVPGSLLEWGVDLSPSSETDTRASQFFRVEQWLERTAVQPLLLVLDDLHWSDPDSLSLLAFLCRRLRNLPVAIVGALRPWPPEAREVVEGLALDGHVSIERLAALTAAGASTLLESRVGHTLGNSLTERAWRLCSGNPLLLEQVARGIARGDEVPEPGARPSDVNNILLARFAGVPAAALRLAQAASVFGARFRPALAGQMAHLPDREADLALQALLAAGLVVGATPGWASFVHPLFCQALYDDMQPPLRERLHAQAFALLRERRVEASEMAEHALRGNLVGDPAAVQALEDAGRAALSTGAIATAASQFGSALGLAGEGASVALMSSYADALLACGRAGAAIPVIERALRQPDLASPARCNLLLRLGRGRFLTGDYRNAQLTFTEAITIAQSDSPARAAGLLLEQAAYWQLAGGPSHGHQAVSIARELAAQTSDTLLQARAEAEWETLRFYSGDAGRLEVIHEFSARAESDTSLHPSDLHWSWQDNMLYNAANVAKLAEDFDEAQRLFAILLERASRLDQPLMVTAVHLGQANVFLRRGRVTEAMDSLARAEARIDLCPVLAPFLALSYAEVLQTAGRSGESKAWLDLLREMPAARHVWAARLWRRHLPAQELLRAGAYAKASDLYRELEEVSARIGIVEPCVLHWTRDGIQAHLAAGRREDGLRVLESTATLAAGLPCRWPRIAVAAGRAFLADLDGDRGLAEKQYQLALGLHEQVELPLERGRTLLDYGAFLRRAGQSSRARALLAEAVSLAEGHGAGWLAASAAEELRVAGGRRRKNAGSELTEQEKRVAQLAALGGTNADIARQLSVSPKTVDTHLQHIYAKLGIASRRELMRRWAAPEAGDASATA
ncbi:MAG: AAA family ATPase [Candidatus Dormibacteria bacterium]